MEGSRLENGHLTLRSTSPYVGQIPIRRSSIRTYEAHSSLTSVRVARAAKRVDWKDPPVLPLTYRYHLHYHITQPYRLPVRCPPWWITRENVCRGLVLLHVAKTRSRSRVRRDRLTWCISWLSGFAGVLAGVLLVGICIFGVQDGGTTTRERKRGWFGFLGCYLMRYFFCLGVLGCKWMASRDSLRSHSLT